MTIAADTGKYSRGPVKMNLVRPATFCHELIL